METLPKAGRRGQGWWSALPTLGVNQDHQQGTRQSRPPPPGQAVTFVARVYSLRQQHTAQLAPGALRVPHLDQVRRHAERVVVNLILMSFPNAVEEAQLEVCN